MRAGGRRARVRARRGAGLLHRPHRLHAADGCHPQRHRVPGRQAARPTRPAEAPPPRRSSRPTPPARSPSCRGPGFVVGGMAKGAAMLAPNMATMLAVLTTDADVEPAQLTTSLRAGVAESFNAMSVDGCTSTNDTVLLLASGAAGPPADLGAFDAAVAEVCLRPRHADGGRRRGPHQGGARPRHRCRLRRRGAARRPEGGREPAREVLVVRQGPVLGPDRQRARARPASPSTRPGSACATATSSSPRAGSPSPSTTPRLAAYMEQGLLEVIGRPGPRERHRHGSSRTT